MSRHSSILVLLDS